MPRNSPPELPSATCTRERVTPFLEDGHDFLIPLPHSGEEADEVSLTGYRFIESPQAWQLAAEDLQAALHKMGVASELCSTPPTGEAIRLIQDPTLGDRAYAVDSEPGTGLSLRAGSLAGIWQAVARVEREMAFRHRPAVPCGGLQAPEHAPLRITSSAYASSIEDPAVLEDYPDGHLAAMARSGYDAFFLYLDLWDFVDSDILPELNGTDAGHYRRGFSDLAARAARYGLRLVPLLNAPGISGDHPVFAAHPEVRGGTVMGNRRHALCTSSAKVHDFFAEQVSAFCATTPAPAAIAFLLGGEGFRHCFMRPNPRTEQVTNCPQCRGHSADAVLAPLLRRLSDTLERVAPGTHPIYWLYSSVVWQNKPSHEYAGELDEALIRKVPGNAVWMTGTMESRAEFPVEGVGDVPTHDYNILQTGSSPLSSRFADAVRRQSGKLALKTETAVSIELHSVPYVPVMQRWYERCRAMRGENACIHWENWRLNGFWPAPSNEVFYWTSTCPGLDMDSLLHRIARRMYGNDAAADVVAAWQCFSEAWQHTHSRFGTYWRGPLYIGPAHPMDFGTVFLTRVGYPDTLFAVNPGRYESETDPATFTDPLRQSPKFFLQPARWASARIRHFTRVVDGWNRGLEKLQACMDRVPAPLLAQAQADLDMATIVRDCFAEDIDYNRFTLLRDKAFSLLPQDTEYAPCLQGMHELLKSSLHRAEGVLPMLRRTPYIGWGSRPFGIRFTPEMVEDKIDLTRQRLRELEAARNSQDGLCL